MPPRTRFASRSILPRHTHPHVHTATRTHPPPANDTPSVSSMCACTYVCVRSRRAEFHLCARSYPQYACVQASEGRRRVIVSLRAFSPRIKNHTHAHVRTHHADNTLQARNAESFLSRLLLLLLIGLITPRTSVALRYSPPPRRVFSESVTHLPRRLAVCLDNCGKSEHPLAR